LRQAAAARGFKLRDSRVCNYGPILQVDLSREIKACLLLLTLPPHFGPGLDKPEETEEKKFQYSCGSLIKNAHKRAVKYKEHMSSTAL
jgi:hypothetical protein